MVAQAWLGEIGPAPHLHFATHEKLASWVTLCPGNNISARKRKHSRSGDAWIYIKPMLIQAAWAAIRVRGRLEGPVQPAGPPVRRGQEPGREEEGDHRDRPHPAQDRLQVLKSGTPYQDRAPTSTPAANPPSRSRLT